MTVFQNMNRFRTRQKLLDQIEDMKPGERVSYYIGDMALERHISGRRSTFERWAETWLIAGTPKGQMTRLKDEQSDDFPPPRLGYGLGHLFQKRIDAEHTVYMFERA